VTVNVPGSPHPADIDDVRLYVFVAQSLAVRPRTTADFDDLAATIGHVRDALNALEALVPSLDEEVGREVRHGCTSLNEAVDIVANSTAASLSRLSRRRLAALNAAGVEHMARALDHMDDSDALGAHTTLELVHSTSTRDPAASD
jgi:hypothetical protein